MNQNQCSFSALNREICVSGFDCGEAELNKFLQVRALIEGERGLNRTTVALGESGNVTGFYSLSLTEITCSELSAKDRRSIPYPSVPAVLIGRLAVDLRSQSGGLGCRLLRHALLKTVLVSKEVGCRYVAVDAKTSKVSSFYQKFGFKPLQVKPRRLILKVSTVIQAGQKSDSLTPMI